MCNTANNVRRWWSCILYSYIISLYKRNRPGKLCLRLGWSARVYSHRFPCLPASVPSNGLQSSFCRAEIALRRRARARARGGFAVEDAQRDGFGGRETETARRTRVYARLHKSTAAALFELSAFICASHDHHHHHVIVEISSAATVSGNGRRSNTPDGTRVYETKGEQPSMYRAPPPLPYLFVVTSLKRNDPIKVDYRSRLRYRARGSRGAS